MGCCGPSDALHGRRRGKSCPLGTSRLEIARAVAVPRGPDALEWFRRVAFDLSAVRAKSRTTHVLWFVLGVVGVSLVKSKQRMADHGEVFTPAWMVEAMLDLVKDETERIDSRFLEPACGSGNFIVSVLRRKLAAVELKFGRSDFEKRQYSLLALMCIYGIELLPDNIEECRANMVEVLADYLGATETDDSFLAASHVVGTNLVHGDAMTMLDSAGQPITFAEWGYLGKGKFQRRDFRLATLTDSAAYEEAGTLFADLGTHDIFTPTRTYAPMTVRDLAEAGK